MMYEVQNVNYLMNEIDPFFQLKKVGRVETALELETSSNMKSLQYFCCFLFLLGLVYFIHPASSANDDYTPCNGSIAECNEEDEKLMGSEISQRFLAQKKSISYGALNKNQPVCNGGSSGEAYSKSGGCLPPPSNPQTRGCSKYYRCRTGS